MQAKNLVSIYDLSLHDIFTILKTAVDLKNKHINKVKYTPLTGKTMGMIFAKSSTRTRVSFEVGLYQLGGHALYMNASDMQLSRGESVQDTSRTLSRYLNALMIRTYDHKIVMDLAKYSSIPVINGLSDMLHPCQILSDIFTIIEKKGVNVSAKGGMAKLRDIKIAYFGDGNTNVSNSWLNIAAKLGLTLYIATPKKYSPEKHILETSVNNIKDIGGKIIVTEDPFEASEKADVIYTDVFISMGKEKEKKERMNALRPFQVNMELLKNAKKDVFVMHCLPAHRGEEITEDVLESKKSIVFDQAENRLHVQKAIMLNLMK